MHLEPVRDLPLEFLQRAIQLSSSFVLRRMTAAMEGENRRRGQMKAEGKGSEAGLATPRGFFGVCASSRRFGRRTGMHGCVLCSSIVHIHRGPGSIQDNVQLLPASHAEIAPRHARYLESL